MKNKVSDLNNHLFLALERLNDEDIKGADLVEEIDRSKAIANIAKQIIDSNRVVVQAMLATEKMSNNDQKETVKRLINHNQ